MSSTSKAVVEKMFAAFAEKDIEKLLETVSPYSVWIYHAHTPFQNQTMKGLKEHALFSQISSPILRLYILHPANI